MPDWVVRLIVTALLVWGVIPNAGQYIRQDAPVYTDEELLARRIEAAAGGTVAISSISENDQSAIVVYVDTPEDWGIELGLVMQGIAQAITEDGVELSSVMLDYGTSTLFGESTGLLNVTADRIVRFIDGRMSQSSFNREMIHTQHNGRAPDIVRP